MMLLPHTDFGTSNGYRTEMSVGNQSLPLAESQHHIINTTNPCRAFDDRIEHRLNIRGRAADDPKHLGCCCLMLKGFAQFCVAFLNFLEQAHILDGYNS